MRQQHHIRKTVLQPFRKLAATCFGYLEIYILVIWQKLPVYLRKHQRTYHRRNSEPQTLLSVAYAVHDAMHLLGMGDKSLAVLEKLTSRIGKRHSVVVSFEKNCSEFRFKLLYRSGKRRL